MKNHIPRRVVDPHEQDSCGGVAEKVTSKKHKPESPIMIESPLMTVEELASLLRLNRETTYKAVSERRIPGVRRIGRTIRIHRQSILAWLASDDKNFSSGADK